LQPPSSLKMLLCDADVSSLDVATATAIGDWVRTGGILWSTRGCASIDELGRPYEQPLLQADITKNGMGKGNATFVLDESLETSGAFVTAVSSIASIVQPRTPPAAGVAASSHENATNASSCPALLPFPYGTPSMRFCCSVKPSKNGMDCPSGVLCCLAAKSCEGNTKCADYHPTPGTTSWQTTTWYSDKAGLVVHFENVSDTGGMSLYGTLELQLVLPHSMSAQQSNSLTAQMLSPYESKPRTVAIQRTGATATRVTVPTPPAYGVIAISMKTDDSAVSTGTGVTRRTPPLGWTSWV
jgi:hypothetical protein